MIFDGVRYPFTHDLTRLRDDVPPAIAALLPGQEDTDRLTQWAQEARYPDHAAVAIEADARAAVGTARTIVDAVLADLRRRGLPPT